MVTGGKYIATAAALLLGSVAALGTNYEHDGKTTYCWAIPQPTNRTKLSETDRTPEFAGDANCPLRLELSLSDTTVTVFEPVEVQWTVTAVFAGSNAIDHAKIFLGKDSKGVSAQIVHSNVHSCVYGTGCDPFNDGKELVDKTVNKIANFTDSVATFEDTIQFPTAGEYSVLAHIILPNSNASSRFDYAVYAKVVVVPATAAPTTTATPATSASPIETSAPVASTGDSGLSQEATVGIIVGGIVAVVALIVIAVILRRRRGSNTNYHPAPISDAGEPGGPKLHQSAVTMTNSTTGFESAWGGDQQRPTMDQTNQSNASSNGYSAPTTTLDRSQDSNTFSKAMQMQDLSASAFSNTGGRKKRVDSDVEL